MFGEYIFFTITSDLQLKLAQCIFLFWGNFWEVICWANVYLSVSPIFLNVNFLQCTHTHTHAGFPCFMGTFQRRSWFYSVETVYFYCLKKSFSIFRFSKHLILYMIYKLVSSWRPKNIPTRISVNASLWGHFFHVGFTRTTYTHIYLQLYA